jgi:O-methyltransferase involved in polyketide biosynthesis
MNRTQQASAHPKPPTAAGIYDYLLGGANHTEADREAAESAMKVAPEARFAAVENRAFLQRAVRYAAAHGVRQFIDLGSGYPTGGAVHEIAAEIEDGPRVLYVDRDPAVAAFCQETVRSPHVAAAVHDLRHPWDIIDDPVTAQVIDWSQPVAVLMVAILHFVPEDPAELIAVFRDHMVPGSYLILSHAVHGENPDDAERAARSWGSGRVGFYLRSPSEVEDLFTGFDLVEPGLTTTTEWRTSKPAPTGQAVILSAVGRCP